MHTFHIPVLGLGYSVDTPVKVAPFGISSVASIVDDEMIERMRKHHALLNGEVYTPITAGADDFRSRRITAYLNLMDRIVDRRFRSLRLQPFEEGTDITRYFRLLPETAALKQRYRQMLALPAGKERGKLESELRSRLVKGAIDVNIMSKVDKMNRNAFGEALGDEYSDASAALRGFANSTLTSSLILSAGMNPRLYSYLEHFRDFYPDENGFFRKKVILKVSDFRSAFIQARFLAKKGIWIAEFRIESGLNCGGHAFATDGYLLGPILDEFKARRVEMKAELLGLYQAGLAHKGLHVSEAPAMRISVQGGIGTAGENQFLLDYYQVDATGWGSPFLLVPEVTNVDEETLKDLAEADTADYYVSDSSPLGVLFNNFRKSSAEKQRLERIAKGRPGSPCKKKYLVSNTEFTSEPICTASREYQHLKIKQLEALGLSEEALKRKIDAVTGKLCLCEGLSAAALVKNKLLAPRENRAVSICPGPNLAWFSRVYTLEEMVGHIYGRINLLAQVKRPNMFINELNLYVAHYRKDLESQVQEFSDKKQKYLTKFREQLLQGIAYYKGLVPHAAGTLQQELMEQLKTIESNLMQHSLAVTTS